MTLFPDPESSGHKLPSHNLPNVTSSSSESERARLIGWCEECKRLLREQEAEEKAGA